MNHAIIHTSDEGIPTGKRWITFEPGTRHRLYLLDNEWIVTEPGVTGLYGPGLIDVEADERGHLTAEYGLELDASRDKCRRLAQWIGSRVRVTYFGGQVVTGPFVGTTGDSLRIDIGVDVPINHSVTGIKRLEVMQPNRRYAEVAVFDRPAS